MKKKIFTWIVSVLFFFPCVIVLAACNAQGDKGFKVLINDKAFGTNENNEIVLDAGTEIGYSAVAIQQDDSEKAIDLDKLTVVDEDNILGTTPAVGTYQISITYAEYPAIVITVVVQKVSLAVPTAPTTEFVYNGQAQQLELNGFDSNKMTITENTKTATGDYTAVVALKDKANTCWTGGSTNDIEIAWSIKKAQAVAPAHDVLNGTYDPAKTLADYTLATGFTWVDNTTVPTVAVNKYKAVYNPDPANYVTSQEVEITLNIAKAQAVAPAHDVLNGTYDPAKTLADYTLATGFTWVNNTTVPTVAVNKYKAVYNPDPANYVTSQEVEITLNIAKAQAVAPAHDILNGTYDSAKTLADYTLATGFTWVDNTTVPTVAVNKYKAVYNPDPANYITSAEVEITLNIAKKQIATPTLKDGVVYEYNAQEQSLQLDNYLDGVMTITGNTGTNADAYQAVVTIVDANYTFADNQSTCTIDWVIIAATPEITFTTQLGKEFDGYAINNPKYTVSGDVESSYKFYVYDGEEWRAIEREEIVKVGNYKIEIETVAGDNFESTTKTEEFTIYYNLKKLQVGLVNGDDRFEYTGEPIEPAVYVLLGEDELGNPILLDPDLYEVSYIKNTIAYGWANYVITGVGDLCKGEVRGEFHIQPGNNNMFAQVTVNGKDATNDGSFVGFDNEPTQSMTVKYTLGSHFENIPGQFAYLLEDADSKPIGTRQFITDGLEIVVPKETRKITIYYYEFGYYVSIHDLTIGLNQPEEDRSGYIVSWLNNASINPEKKTILKPKNLEVDFETYVQTAVDENNYSLDWEYNENGYVIDSFELNGDKITFVLKADGLDDVVVSYTVIDAPNSNSAYLYIDLPSGLSIATYTNNLVLGIGFGGDLETVMKECMSNPEKYYIYEEYAQGYTYKSLSVANNVLTIILERGTSQIALKYPIEDLTKLASTFISYIQYDYEADKINVHYQTQQIELIPGFTGDIAALLQNLNTQGLIELNQIYVDGVGNITPFEITGVSVVEENVRFEIVYTDPENAGVTVTYYVDFEIIDNSDGYCAVETIEQRNINGDVKLYEIDETTKYLKVTDTLSVADRISFSFSIWGGLTDWEIYKGETLVTDFETEGGYAHLVDFQNIPGAGVYTIKVYRGDLFDTYTLEIVNFNDDPYFMFTYKEQDYVFSMDIMNSNINFAVNLDTEVPEYLYVYLGELDEGVEEFEISGKSVIKTVYDQDMNLITNMESVKLKILTDEKGNQYSLAYVFVEDITMPIYFYHYTKDIKAGEDIKIRFAGQDLVYSKTPTQVGEKVYNGSFESTGGILLGMVTKDQIGYVDGDTTVNFEVLFAGLMDVLVYDLDNMSMLMGITDHKGTFSATVKYDAPVPYLVFILSDMTASSYTQMIIQIVDELPEEV